MMSRFDPRDAASVNKASQHGQTPRGGKAEVYIHPEDPMYAILPSRAKIEYTNNNTETTSFQYRDINELFTRVKSHMQKQIEDVQRSRAKVEKDLRELPEEGADYERNVLTKKLESLQLSEVYAFQHFVKCQVDDEVAADSVAPTPRTWANTVVVKPFKSLKSVEAVNRNVKPERCRKWRPLEAGEDPPTYAPYWVAING